MLSLSPEICKRIVQNSHYWQDVLALCLTCKAFQKDAEVKLYSQLQFTDPRRAVLACNTLLDNERLALHVRGFWFNQQNDRQRPTNLGREFWSLIQKTLIAMSNLEALVLCDRSYANGWVLEHPGIQFKLKEAKLWFVWNAALTAFLDRQDTLQTFHFVDSLDVINHQVTPNALPCLRIFDGTLMVTMQLLSCPLVHLQVIVDADSNPAIVLLQQLGHLRKTLTSLNLLDVPEEWSTRFLGTVSLALPDLKHIGIFPYPIVSVGYIYHVHLALTITSHLEARVLQTLDADAFPEEYWCRHRKVATCSHDTRWPASSCFRAPDLLFFNPTCNVLDGQLSSQVVI